MPCTRKDNRHDLKTQTMKHRNNFLTTIIVTVIALTVVVIFFTINKPVSKRTEPASLKKVAVNDTFRVRPLTNIRYERTAERLKRGEYLTTGLLQCFTCHSPRNWKEPGAPPIAEQLGSGGTILVEDSTTLAIAPNITPDKETGAGTWTDDMLGRAIREGVGHDGRALYWQMPSTTFRSLSDEDLASVIVYLRSIPAVYNAVRPIRMPKELRSGIERSLNPLTKPVEMPDLSDTMKRGRYLVALGECVGCHTSHSEYNPGLLAGGNFIDRFGRKDFSANITSHSSGMSYGPEGFIFVLRTGKGGTLSPIMPWIAYKNMTDDDLKVMYAYLKKILSSQHYVSNQAPFSHCVICGQEHGLGKKNKLEKPTGIKPDPDLYDLYAGTYFNEVYNLTPTIAREGNKLIFRPWENGPRVELIPQSEQHFLAPGWVLPVSFVKDKSGHVTQMIEDSDLGGIYKKIK